MFFGCENYSLNQIQTNSVTWIHVGNSEAVTRLSGKDDWQVVELELR